MKDIRGIVLVVFVTVCSCSKAPAKPPSGAGLEGSAPSSVQVLCPNGGGLNAAITESMQTTNSPYVLVAWVNTMSGERHRSAVPVMVLLGAIRNERGLSHEEAVRYVTGNMTSALEFGDKAALQELTCAYSEGDLTQVRNLLASATTAEMVESQNNLRSELNVLSVNKYGRSYGYMSVVLHLLLERGVQCGAGCKPGLIYLVK